MRRKSKPKPKKKPSRREPRKAHVKRLKKFQSNDVDEYDYVGEEFNPQDCHETYAPWDD